jgi:putative ABC transport system permease protein
MRHDLRYAIRNLRRAPGFAALIVATLALGIGANTAIFSVINALLFEPLPYADAGRLTAITFADDEEPLGIASWPYPKYAAFATVQRTFEATAAYGARSVNVVLGDRPIRAQAEVVTASYFPLLGIQAAAGRVFRPEEDQVLGEAPVVVVTDQFWRTHLGADPGVLGRTVTIRARPYEVIGVMPPSFRGQAGTTDLWITTMAAEHALGKGSISGGAAWWMGVIAKLREGETAAQAEAAMPALVPEVDAIFAARMRPGEERYRVVPLKDLKIDADVRRSFVLLLGAVGFVLLIACANTAGLLLGRAVARQREFAVRRALGAGRARIVRQVAIESLLVSLAAGAAALGVAWLALDWLTAVRPANTSGFWAQYARTFTYFDVSLDLRVLAFNFVLAIGGGLLFGMAPAWQASRGDLNGVLKRGTGASAAGFRGISARHALVAAEIALSLVLLTAAGLMTRSFAAASTRDLGFDPDGVLTMTIAPSGSRAAPFYYDLLERVQGLPGVERAALSVAVPLGPGGFVGPVEIEGRPRNEGPRGALNLVTPDFAGTYRMRLVEGRWFHEGDLTGPPVTVVSRALAEAAWPGQSAVGKRIRSDLATREWMEVVGVLDHVTYTSLEDAPASLVYAPVWRPANPKPLFNAPTTISVRTTVEPNAMARAIGAQVQALDATAPVYGVLAMSERAQRVTARYRYSMVLMLALAGLALLLSAMGTYGVMAYTVAMRTREIGIRMALGAGPRDVLGEILGGGLRLAAVGILAGAGAALLATRLLTALLYGVSPADPATFAAGAVVMVGVAGLASYLPARRAMRVDPVVALRVE